MGRTVSVPYKASAVCYSALLVDDDESTDYQSEFDHFVDWFKEVAQKQWPSLQECNYWLGREDHALLENDHAYLGMSEYCNLLSLWIVPKESNIAAAWCAQIEKNFYKHFAMYRKVATFSNGEAVYERVRDNAAL